MKGNITNSTQPLPEGSDDNTTNINANGRVCDKYMPNDILAPIATKLVIHFGK